MKKLFAFSTLAITLTSCGKHSDGTSVWAGGLFVIPVVLALAAVFFLYKAYRASKSGSTQQMPNGKWVDSKDNMPITRIPFFWFSIAFIVAAIVVVIAVNGAK